MTGFRKKEELPYATLVFNFVEAPKKLAKGFNARVSFGVADGKDFYASKWGRSEKELSQFFSLYQEGETVEAQIEVKDGEGGDVFTNLREMRKRTTNEIIVPPSPLAQSAAKAAPPLPNTQVTLDTLIAYLRQTADLLEKKKKDVEAFL